MTTATGTGELVVLKQSALFLCAQPSGDFPTGSPRGEGLYSNDTRFLSELALTVGGVAPVLLSSTPVSCYESEVALTNEQSTDLGSRSLSIRRAVFLGDRLYHRLELRNRSDESIATEIEVRLAADFADIFEVRSVHRRDAPRLVDVSTDEGKLRFGYLGLDGVRRETFVEARPVGRVEVSGSGFGVLSWPLSLEARGHARLEVTVETSLDGSRSRKVPLERARQRAVSKTTKWLESCASVDCSSTGLGRVFETSIEDVEALVTPSDDGDMIAAGIPWYVASFGRDALITSMEMLVMTREPALLTLRHLARLQASTDDSYRDAEPGKILHEQRRGELARSGSIPHSPYYGTVDATALFVMLAAAHWRWSADLELIKELEPALEAALTWIDDHGDRDDDGFVEYSRRSPLGLRNQGWKDSENSMVHADGTPAVGPIALVEVQGYAYSAKRGMAEFYRALGRPERASSLEAQAARLRDAFNDAFWMPAEDTYALALDGSKRQVRSVTSNPGHCLYCGIVDEARAEAMADRMLAGDMFSGWGIRTLSKRSISYDPASYHNGSIWPHDNAIIAAGFKRCGLTPQADRVATAMLEAGLVAHDARLPELFCGYERKSEAGYVPYAVACRPQAWSAAAPFMFLQAMLGICPDAPAGLLNVRQPQLPLHMNRVLIRDVRVGSARVNLEFSGAAETTECRFSAGDGLKVVIQR